MGFFHQPLAPDSFNLSTKSNTEGTGFNARNMSIIAEDENLLRRAAKYLRKLVAEKEDPLSMFKRV